MCEPQTFMLQTQKRLPITTATLIHDNDENIDHIYFALTDHTNIRTEE
jgi:hypothetical protein